MATSTHRSPAEGQTGQSGQGYQLGDARHLSGSRGRLAGLLKHGLDLGREVRRACEQSFKDRAANGERPGSAARKRTNLGLRFDRAGGDDRAG
jgi:hypothetical protein